MVVLRRAPVRGNTPEDAEPLLMGRQYMVEGGCAVGRRVECTVGVRWGVVGGES